MRKSALLLLLLIGICYHVAGQAVEPNPKDSWKKRSKAGDAFMKKGDYSSATAHYMSALADKPKKKELAFKASKAAFKAHRYEDLAKAAKRIKNENKKYPKAKFYYAMGLKASGFYEEAAVEFDAFSDIYRENDYQVYSDWATREMQGCALAKETEPQKNIKLNYLTKVVNSPRKEFSPIPFGNDILYFSSDSKASTKIYRTERIDRTWKEPIEPTIFGAMEKEHFSGGSFTPNKKRFYFTQCDIVDGEYRCDIYVMQRNPSNWSKPIKLPDYINSQGYSATDPFVVVRGGQEILYFSSDREGGVGGKDIWFAIKNSKTDDLNFDIPVNLGDNINTSQDEISPYYVTKNNTLYFSSNGHINIGGFDVFKAEGKESSWKNVANLGTPINSSANDTYYILDEDMTSGFLASNRVFGSDKNQTDNDDLFQFFIKEEEIVLEGKIHEQGNATELVSNVMVTIYEVTNGGEYALNSNITPDGYYQFVVLPNKEYIVKTEKDGYEVGNFDINTGDYEGANNIPLDLPIASQAVTQPSDVRTNPPGVDVVQVDPTIDDQGSDVSPPGVRPGPPTKKKFKNNTDDKPVDQDAPGNPNAGSDENNHPQRETAVVDEPDPKPTKPAQKPVVNNNDDEPIFDDPDEDQPTSVKPKTSPVASNNSDAANSNAVNNNFPNEGNTLGTKHLSELSDAEKEQVEIYNGKPYLQVQSGFYFVDTKPKVDKDFPGVGGGIGSHYRIQLAAVSKYRARKYKNAEDLNLGEFVTESTTSREGKEVTRVMISSFANFSSAKSALRKLRAQGYARAFIIRYEDNRRVGRMIRDID